MSFELHKKHDPLAAFRRKTAGTAAELPPLPKGASGYVAFETKDHVQRLAIHPKNYPTHMPGYQWLLNITTSGDDNINRVVLTFSFLGVFISGQNLNRLVMALSLGSAEYIREFDPQKWAKPTETDACVIESIQLIVQQGGPSMPDNEKLAKGGWPKVH